MLTFMLCACSVILLQNNNVSPKNSFTVNLLCMLGGLAVCAVMFLPPVILKKRFDTDFLTLSGKVTPKLKIPLAALYALYFVYASVYFLLPYTDMFCKKYYPGASPCIIGLCVLAACVYAACKGANIITRFGIFLFVFALAANFLMFGGSIGSVDFANSSFLLYTDFESAASAFIYFCSPSFIAVIYACLAGDTENFRLSQPFFALLFTALKYALVLFFVAFSVGAYAQRQEYQSFILSRVAHFDSFGGIESFFTALATMSVFMIISMFLSCVNKSTGGGGVKNSAAFALIIFIAAFMAEWNNSVKEIFTNDVILIIFTAVVAVFVPLAYIFTGRKIK